MKRKKPVKKTDYSKCQDPEFAELYDKLIKMCLETAKENNKLLDKLKK